MVKYNHSSEGNSRHRTIKGYSRPEAAAQINKMSFPTEETDNVADTVVRSSSHERTVTEKGQEVHDQDTKKHEKNIPQVL